MIADVAQLVEQCFRKAKVGGSIPPIGSVRRNYSRLANLEEKTNFRKALLFILLSIGAIIVIFFFGLPITARFVSFVSDIGKTSKPIEKEDTTPPAPPKINNLPEVTNKNNLEISGFSESGSIVIFTINESIQEVVASNDGSFTTTLPLKKGENILTINAKDPSGNESVRSENISVFYDDEPQILNINSPEDKKEFFGPKQKQITVSGSTKKESSFTINDRPIKLNDDGTFSTVYSLVEGDNSLNIKSTDKAGNMIEKSITFKFTP